MAWLRRSRADLGMLLLLALLALLPVWLGERVPRHAVFAMDTPDVVLKQSGLNEIERYKDRPGTFRWTNGYSSLTLPNPGGPLGVTLRLATPGTLTPLEIRTTGQAFAFAVQPQLRTYTLLLPPSERDRVAITFASPTVKDRRRDIGVALGDLMVTGGGSPATQSLALIGGAAIAGFMLLRQAGWRVRSAGPTAAAVLAACAAGLLLGGWRYTFASTVFGMMIMGSLAAVALDRWWPAHAGPFDESLPRVRWRREAGVIVLLLLAALAVRAVFLAAPDPVGDMEISARRMWLLHERGLASAYSYEGDYMPLRLYVLRGLSALVPVFGGDYFTPLPAATKILLKLPNLLSDAVTIVLLYGWSRRWLSVAGAAGLAALYALAPPVWINVAWWGQVDASLMLPLLGVVLLLDRRGGLWSWLCFAAAVLVKPQAILLLPLLFISTLRLHGARGIVRGAALAGAVIALASMPLVLAGAGEGMLQAYVGSTERFPRITLGAYNLWYLLFDGQHLPDSIRLFGVLRFRTIGLLLVGGATALVCWALLRRSDRIMRAEAAAATAFAFFCLPTQIHERYLFLVLAFLALAVAADRRLLALFVLLIISATINVLGELDAFWPAAAAWIVAGPLPDICAVLNLAVLAILFGHMLWLAFHRPALATPSATKTRNRLTAETQN